MENGSNNTKRCDYVCSSCRACEAAFGCEAVVNPCALGLPDTPHRLISRLLRSRTQPRRLDSCYRRWRLWLFGYPSRPSLLHREQARSHTKFIGRWEILVSGLDLQKHDYPLWERACSRRGQPRRNKSQPLPGTFGQRSATRNNRSASSHSPSAFSIRRTINCAGAKGSSSLSHALNCSLFQVCSAG